MACRASRDEHGTTYFVPEDKTARTPGGHVLPGVSALQVWWGRRFRDRRDETLLIRQENSPQRADVIELTLGQAYDLIHALCTAVMRA
jgi:hypothetical protein